MIIIDVINEDNELRLFKFFKRHLSVVIFYRLNLAYINILLYIFVGFVKYIVIQGGSVVSERTHCRGGWVRSEIGCHLLPVCKWVGKNYGKCYTITAV